MNRMMVSIAVLFATATAGFAEYRPEQWNLEARQKFAEQRFGIFIHWGIYSTYSREAGWFLLNAKDEEAYARAKDGFYPSKFDAAEWARTIKSSGARYVTFTSRHHDGFSLWPTKVDDGYNVSNTPFRRDIVGELAKACADEGLQFNLYYSLADWHRKDYPRGVRGASVVVRDRNPDYPSYRRFMLAQLGELLENYRPGLIWFDGEWDVTKDAQGKAFDWQLEELYDLIHAHHALVINNNHHVTREKEDIQTFERDLPGENASGLSKGQAVVRDRPLEQSDIIQRGAWAYDITKQNFRPPEEVVAMIVRAAAKDSNMLMNVGPDGSGRFPRRVTDILAGVGKWMAANGEAIYGTRGAGLVKNADGSETAKTRKGDVVYEITIRKGQFPEVRKACAGLANPAVSEPPQPVAECNLPRGSRELWDVKALNATPKTFPVTIPCSNEYGRVAGIEPIFVEGEPWRGRPTRVFAWWGLPKGASATQKAPAMVLVHGGGGTAFARWVKTWNDRGYAAIAMDTCGSVPQGERDGRAHPRHEWSGPSGWADSVAQIGEPLKDQWTYHAVAAVMRCHSFLRSRPEVDGGRIGLTGISWGGYLSSIVASVDDRFRFAAPVYGCGYYERNHEWHQMNGDKEKLRAWFALWDPKNFYDSPAGGAKIPYLWCCGTNDRWYPLDTVRMSCNLLDRTVPLNLSLKYRMPHGHPPAGDPKEITAYADSFLKGGKPLVDVPRAWLEKDVLRAEFDAHGRKAVRAELLYTCDTNAVLAKRAWKVAAVADFDAAGRLSAPVPAESVMFFANVITDDGLVASSRIFQREDWGLVDHPRNPSTDWMVGGCGAFVHYLMDTDMFARIGEFDVPALAKQIADMKPDWFCITLGQNTGYMCSPNATYERVCGYAPGSHCSTRDIPAELIAALKPHGVKVMLYLPCQPPNRDRHAEEAFGFPAGAPNARPTDRVINAVAAKRWSAVIEEWSRRYGKDVVGWWFDGSYRRSRFNDEIAAIYAAAVKRGNPDAVVAFNEGVKSPVRRWSMAGDYLAGEINNPLKETCPGRWSDDRQWHLLTFAGSTWGSSKCRYTDAQWIDWLKPVLANGGAVTIDLAIDRPTGRLDPAQTAQLKRVFSAGRAPLSYGARLAPR